MSGYGSHDFLALPDDVIAFAWSAPMRDLAAQIGITDVGLKKLLKGCGIATPPQGHWNRVLAGRKVGAPPPAPPRGPGESGRVRLDSRFRGRVPEAGAMSEHGPFASAAVPESLEALREQERRAIGKITVVRELDRPHRALAALVKRDAQRVQKDAQSDWWWDGPRWRGPMAQRQLKLLDALFRALSKWEHESWIRVGSGELQIWCQIGTTQFELVAGRPRQRYGREQAPSGHQWG